METQYGVRNSCCNLWSWGDAPLVDADTHNARKAAHSAFDELWKRHGMKRRQAYMYLAEEMAIDPDLCHIKLMNKVEAGCVPGAALRILARWQRKKDFQVIE
jgi:hypothetical protein